MSDLNEMITEHSASFNAESYNSWRYGDEASLYSIAEDSREDRQSEALSGAMTDHAHSTVTGGSGGDRGGGGSAGFTLTGMNPWERSVGSYDDDDDDYDDAPVEVKWVTDVEMDAALAEMPPIISSSSSSVQGNHHHSRMYINLSGGGGGVGATAATKSGKRGGGGGRHAAVAPVSSPGSIMRSRCCTPSEEDQYQHTLGYRLNARPYRLVLVACLLCVAIAGTVLAVTLTMAEETDNDDYDGQEVSTGSRSPDTSDRGNNNNNDYNGDADDEREPEDIVDTLAPATLLPTPSPTMPTTSQPTENYEEIIDEAAQEFVYSSISACPYADVNEFFEISLPQAEVFQELIIDLKGGARVNPTDESVSFEPNHGTGYLLERWALLMLFFSTNGEYWERNGGWYSDSDVCEWETALRICEPRVDGEAAMTYLDLHSFGLVGTIPKELCCMPKLKKLFLYSNRLTGEVPECLFLMGLEDMDLSNNKFTSTSGISLTTTTQSFNNDTPPPP